jgi:hypothetical protein
MASVQVQVAGGSIKQVEADTIEELKAKLGASTHQATVNGEPQDGDYDLSDFEFVTLTAKVKGARS